MKKNPTSPNGLTAERMNFGMKSWSCQNSLTLT